MNEEIYFVIYNSDGDTTVGSYSREGLLERLAEDHWGMQPMTAIEWASGSRDTNYWGNKMLIIKGSIARVTPPGDWRVE